MRPGLKNRSSLTRKPHRLHPECHCSVGPCHLVLHRRAELLPRCVRGCGLELVCTPCFGSHWVSHWLACMTLSRALSGSDSSAGWEITAFPLSAGSISSKLFQAILCLSSAPSAFSSL